MWPDSCLNIFISSQQLQTRKGRAETFRKYITLQVHLSDKHQTIFRSPCCFFFLCGTVLELLMDLTSTCGFWRTSTNKRHRHPKAKHLALDYCLDPMQYTHMTQPTNSQPANPSTADRNRQQQFRSGVSFCFFGNSSR